MTSAIPDNHYLAHACYNTKTDKIRRVYASIEVEASNSRKAAEKAISIFNNKDLFGVHVRNRNNTHCDHIYLVKDFAITQRGFNGYE